LLKAFIVPLLSCQPDAASQERLRCGGHFSSLQSKQRAS